ncbi:protein of unknown function [Cnuella takakiae]|uniref:DUF4422 domain-containing protein n=1 Tax=Cnuella takakiae TaxID=1302690 RepID=A0A1M5GU43_9BACT|nr:DUF4422 domain-containing protein [Cnuella takakiae]SHG07155.1 protein of unknown function [Cnuella takakiae]
MSQRLLLYSVFHKPAPMPQAPYVVPIQVGAAGAQMGLGMLTDATGDHISGLNPYWSELTALYWIWKNADRSAADAWGLCHYRRYFSLPQKKLLFLPRSRSYYALNQRSLDAVVTTELYSWLQGRLQTHDVVVQQPTWAHKKGGKTYSIAAAYALQHNQRDWDRTMDLIRQLFPEYDASIKAFEQENRLSYYNMMVARWPVWDGYLEWLFRILFALRDELGDTAAPRLYGYLSERLMNLYLRHNGLRAAYSTIALLER